MLAVITYDIPNDKRRLKLSNLLEGYGWRVQESVFECFLTLKEMRQLYQRVLKQVNPAEDNVRFYWISQESMTKALTIGSPLPQPPPSVYII